MNALPKVLSTDCQECCGCTVDLKKALEIAWEAMGEIVGDETEPLTDEGLVAVRAMSRISALGKE